MGTTTVTNVIKAAKKLHPMQLDTEFKPFLEYIKGLKLKNFLEIGTAHGGTFLALSNVVKGLGISIDMPHGVFGGISPEAMAKRNRTLLATCKGSNYFIADNSHSLTIVERVKQILKQGKAHLELLFIDGDHTYNGVLLDYLLYQPLIKKGVIVFHDIKDTPPHRNVNCNVSQLWKQLQGEKKEFLDASEQWGGIGVLSVDR